MRHYKTKELLKFLAAGTGILILSLFAPQLPPRLLKAYFKNRAFKKGLFLRDLKRLQMRELLDFREMQDGTIKIVLKRRGEKLALIYRLEDIQIKKPPRWDKKWRSVIFDIPHKKKRARDALRNKLIDLGFYPLQKSVFIYPYPCENEIDFIASLFDIRKYILLLTVSDFEGSDKMRYHFGFV